MSEMISIRTVDFDTGKEEVLYEREGSSCYFMKWFSYKNYNIQLRLDAEDILVGEPTLDADIYDRTTGQRIRNGLWHHTTYEHDTQAGRAIYDFVFQDLKLRLCIVRNMAKTFTADAILRTEGEQ